MKLKRSPQPVPSRLEVVDAIRQARVAWRSESRAVAECYRTWSASIGPARSAAFDRYVAALDREEHAAGGYRSLLQLGHSRNDPRGGAG
jgi:hypothetical protein